MEVLVSTLSLWSAACSACGKSSQSSKGGSRRWLDIDARDAEYHPSRRSDCLLLSMYFVTLGLVYEVFEDEAHDSWAD